jgi:hypothetical protein
MSPDALTHMTHLARNIKVGTLVVEGLGYSTHTGYRGILASASWCVGASVTIRLIRLENIGMPKK